MGFYGILIGVVGLISLLLLAKSAAMAGQLGLGTASLFDEYSNLQRASFISSMVAMTYSNSTPQQHRSWLTAVEASAEADGALVKTVGNVTFIETGLSTSRT